MKTKITFAVLGSLLAVSAILASLDAFVIINPPRKWFQGIGGGPNDLPVPFYVYSGGEESVNDGDNGVTATRDAIEYWNAEVHGLVTTGVTGSNVVSRDGLNITSFNDPAKIVRNALAVTLVGWVDPGQTETVNGITFARYLESDTSFSKRTDFTTQAIGGCNGEHDLQAVEAHEIGHALGLDHPPVPGALMYASIASCDFKRIHTDDVAGINTIYTPGYGGPAPCTATEARLTTHTCGTGRGPNCLVVKVGFTDDCGNPVAGAAVTVQLFGQEAGDVLTGTAETNASGEVSFGLRCRDASSSTYTSTVISLGGSLPWSSNDPDNTADVSTSCPTI